MSIFMKIAIHPLNEFTHHIEELVQALFTQWHDFAPWSSPEKIRAYYRQYLNHETLPCAFVAVDADSGRLLGSAALKRHDIAQLPQYEHWLGDVFVLPAWRGAGVGGVLVRHCLSEAKQLGIGELYLYTPDVQAVYEHYGWREIETRWYNGETVSVMKLDLGQYS
ncbi:GNAT family N-acetyltransferase [Neisseria wadsworthii]